MKPLMNLLIASFLLLTPVFGQELKGRASKQAPAVELREPTVITVSPGRSAPVIQPKPLPQLSLSLGEIARRARAARAAGPKAQVVVNDDLPLQSAEGTVSRLENSEAPPAGVTSPDEVDLQ